MQSNEESFQLSEGESGRRTADVGPRIDSVRRDAETSLREIEERYRALLTAISDFVYRMAPDWREMRHLAGREFIADTHEPNRSWLEKYILPEDRENVVERIEEAIRTRGIFEYEHRVKRLDGTNGWVYSRAVPVLNPDGEIVEWFGAASDVTRRKEAEEGLKRSNESAQRQHRLYEAILNNTPDLAYIFDLDHRFIYANEGLLTMWGRSWDEAIGRTCLELGYPDWHAEMHDREIEQVVATKQPIRGEVPFSGTFGRRIYDYIFVPVFGANGEVEAVAGTTRDVTDYKQAEQALRLHTEQFETLVNQAPLGLYLVDADLRLSHVNPIALPLFSEIPNLIGRSFEEVTRILWPTEFADEVIQIFRRTLETGETYEVPERVWERADRGTTEVYEWRVDRILLPEGRYGVVCYFRDVSTQVNARLAIESARAEAEEANLAKSTFLATMSHELRTPLNAIIGYADLLEAEVAGPLNDPQRTHLGRIDLGARHLLRIIEEILTFSRIEAGKEEVQVEAVDLAELARQTCRLIEPLAAQKALSFTCDVPPRLEARSDPGKVRQILLNLLSNAVKFTEEGEVRLALESDDTSIHLHVKDSGIGIRSDDLDRIFEPFSQVEQAPSRRAGGTGLGLSVTRQLSRLLGGDVSVQSAPGRGSAFSVRLPRELPQDLRPIPD